MHVLRVHKICVCAVKQHTTNLFKQLKKHHKLQNDECMKGKKNKFTILIATLCSIYVAHAESESSILLF